MSEAAADLRQQARTAQKLADVQLVRRAAAGAALNATERARLEEIAAAGEAEQGPALSAVHEEVKALRAAGKAIPKRLVQAAREEWLADMATHVWADVGVAAKDLGVSVQTVRNWLDEAGITHQRTAIAKAEVYRWLWQREAAKRKHQTSDLDEQIKEVRLAQLRGTVIAQAREVARQATEALKDYLRDGLLSRGPTDLVDLMRRAKDQADAEDAVEAWLRQRIDHLDEQLQEGGDDGR